MAPKTICAKISTAEEIAPSGPKTSGHRGAAQRPGSRHHHGDGDEGGDDELSDSAVNRRQAPAEDGVEIDAKNTENTLQADGRQGEPAEQAVAASPREKGQAEGENDAAGARR